MSMSPPMTRMPTRPTGMPSRSGPRANGIRVAPAKRQRSLPLVAVGVLLVVGFGLAAAVVQMRTAHRTAVLAVSRPVAIGQQIQPTDLSTVRISVDPALRPVRATEISSVVGHSAAVQLVPGSLVTQGAVADSSRLQKGKVVVGLALKPGQLPAGTLRVGDQVLLISTGASSKSANGDSAADQGTVLVRQATVYGLGSAARSADSSSTISIVVDEADAPAVAAAGAAGQVSLVLRAAS